MPTDKLHAALDELHRQLEATKSIDEEARQHLRAAMEEVRQVLEQQDKGTGTKSAPGPEGGPIDRLRKWVEDFEGDHPTLTAALSDLITSLRNMGF